LIELIVSDDVRGSSETTTANNLGVGDVPVHHTSRMTRGWRELAVSSDVEPLKAMLEWRFT
jgi:hypothetical protein